jgi:hypothetical protein
VVLECCHHRVYLYVYLLYAAIVAATKMAAYIQVNKMYTPPVHTGIQDKMYTYKMAAYIQVYTMYTYTGT